MIGHLWRKSHLLAGYECIEPRCSVFVADETLYRNGIISQPTRRQLRRLAEPSFLAWRRSRREFERSMA